MTPRLTEVFGLAESYGMRADTSAEGMGAYNHPSKVALDLGSGWRWVKIITPSDSAMEADLMRHCGIATHSLRDPKGYPHVSAYVKKNEYGDWDVSDIGGKANGPASPKYRPYIEKFKEAVQAQKISGE